MEKKQVDVTEVSWFKKYGLLLAAIVMAIVVALPTPEGLTIAGQRILGVLCFAVITWISECVPYPVSATIIGSLMLVSLGTAPSLDPKLAFLGKTIGFGQATNMTFSGLSAGGTVLVAAALFLSAAMMATGLDKRIALTVLSRVGSNTKRVVAGTIFVGFVLAFFIPSTTARVGCIIPIVLGIIHAFGVSLNSVFSACMMLATVHAASIWNIGIKTAAAQNMVAIGFIEKELDPNGISWLHWFIAAAPYAIVMSVILYYICIKLLPPEIEEVENGDETVRKAMAELGPITAKEKKLLIISFIMLGFWVTEKVLHPVSTTASTCIAITLMFLPGIEIMNWKDAQAKISWGTLLLFGIGISLGSALLKTGAAKWMANWLVVTFGLKNLGVFAVFAIMAAFLIVVHIGFASATAVASAIIPVVIAVLQSLGNPSLNMVDITMLCQFVVSFGFILPVNSPQGILAFGTDTFTSKQCMKVGIPITIVGYVVLLIFAQTYWKLLGIM